MNVSMQFAMTVIMTMLGIKLQKKNNDDHKLPKKLVVVAQA
jgi:hypothetical protein